MYGPFQQNGGYTKAVFFYCEINSIPKIFREIDFTKKKIREIHFTEKEYIDKKIGEIDFTFKVSGDGLRTISLITHGLGSIWTVHGNLQEIGTKAMAMCVIVRKQSSLYQKIFFREICFH